MDPNEALKRARALTAQIIHSGDDAEMIDTAQRGEQLAEAFDALDEWLSRGGFKPAEWE